MPTISRFYGILIKMQYNDHRPPHFHVSYGEYEASYEIDPVALYAGELPPQADRLVKKWAKLYQRELMDDWEAAMMRVPLKKIDPLM